MATLTYRTISKVPKVSIYSYSGAQCSQRHYMGQMRADGVPYERWLGRMIDPALATFPSTVAAGSSYSSTLLLDVSGNGNVICNVGFRFTPLEGASYEALVSHESQRCQVRVERIGAVKDGSAQRVTERITSPNESCS